mmetsp:Transcript_23215/g.35307  ORF Transcript_23215/g.35307 Transcript_23215/m.35307 type:complete len:88 (-) Transcript_23215:1477-1740(-)
MIYHKLRVASKVSLGNQSSQQLRNCASEPRVNNKRVKVDLFDCDSSSIVCMYTISSWRSALDHVFDVSNYFENIMFDFCIPIIISFD